MPDLGISVGETVSLTDRMGGSPPPAKKNDGGEQVPIDNLPKCFTTRLFHSVTLFARPSVMAFSTCLKPA